MATFEAGNKDVRLQGMVKDIMAKYVDKTPFTEEICDQIMTDVLETFGKEADAKVMIDTDTNEIEITVRDLIKQPMTFSSLKLFKAK